MNDSKLILYLKGFGMMVGMIFGAGVFALPYIISRAGIFWGLVQLVIVLFLIIVLHLFYADVSFYSEERMRLPGQIRRFLGPYYESIAVVIVFFSNYATLLIYGILGGIFLNNLFPWIDQQFLTYTYFLLAGILSFFRLQRLSLVNLFLTIPVFLFVFFLFGKSFGQINFENFILFGNNADWFIPYGVWLFALSGFSSITETRDLFYRQTSKELRRVIVGSILVSLLGYLIFTASVLNITGLNTTEDALSGLKFGLGREIIVFGSIFGFLTVFTSSLSLAANFKNTFRFDYKRNYFLSWFLVVFPPSLFYLAGLQNFVQLIQIVGAVSLGIFGVFIVLMRRNITGIRQNKFLNAGLIIALILGVLFEIVSIF